MHYLLIYDVVPDYAERRGAHRDEHLALARAALARGELVLGGALADPIDSAVLLFEADDARAVERFVAADPYVRHGLVTSWRVRPWTTEVGVNAAVRPAQPSARADMPSPAQPVATPRKHRGLLARTLERWSPRDLLTSWAAYWAAFLAVSLGPAALAVARVTIPVDAHGTFSAGFGDGGLVISVTNAGHEVFHRATSLEALALWIAGPPLLVWAAWLFARPSRELPEFGAPVASLSLDDPNRFPNDSVHERDVVVRASVRSGNSQR